MTDDSPPSLTADAVDPSMEEILASIRRILNEDDVSVEQKAAAPADPGDDGVLVLDQTMMVSIPKPIADVVEPEAADPTPEPEPAGPAPLRARSREREPFVEPEAIEPPVAEQAPVPVMDAVTPPPWEQPAPNRDLIAPEAAAAATSSVSTLMRSLAAGRATQVYAGGPTLEDMVRAELRPLLKEWLDANLPPMVERLVRTEIERVVGRAVP